jgi:beta-ribofuranosylaminobenzene 5'-phosphate synthase
MVAIRNRCASEEKKRMIRIRTPSRLHFGLLSIPCADAPAWSNQEGEGTLPRRHFGGVGLMIDRPGIELTLEPAATWSADGPLAERALGFAKQYSASVGIDASFHLRIAEAAPEHAGLGTGTQLGLAVASALAEITQQKDRDAGTLARHVGRGKRSALGVHGFAFGGFLVEAGKRDERTIAPLLGRWEFPSEWGVLLIVPRGLQGRHGTRERDAFANLAQRNCDDRTTEILSRIALLGLIPALLERDLTAFGESLYDFNRRVGAMFQPAQGDIYAEPRCAEIVRAVRAFGIPAVGQSSWGPTIFAVVRQDQASSFCDWLVQKERLTREEIILTRASNCGAILSTE